MNYNKTADDVAQELAFEEWYRVPRKKARQESGVRDQKLTENLEDLNITQEGLASTGKKRATRKRGRQENGARGQTMTEDMEASASHSTISEPSIPPFPNPKKYRVLPKDQLRRDTMSHEEFMWHSKRFQHEIKFESDVEEKNLRAKRKVLADLQQEHLRFVIRCLEERIHTLSVEVLAEKSTKDGLKG